MAKLSDKHTPDWWNHKHSTAWDRAKEAFARDWEQTKADFSKTKGQELNQDVGDTVKQAVGKAPIPPGATPNPSDDYQTAEPALRYGFGASEHYADHKAWNPDLETQLRTDWEQLESGRDFNSVKNQIRSGWERARGGR